MFEFGIRDKVLLFFDDPAYHPMAKGMSILIMILQQTSGGFGALRAIRLVRVMRVMKMSKYTAGVGVLLKAMQISMQPLAVLSFFVLIAVIIFSSLMYYIERNS